MKLPVLLKQRELVLWFLLNDVARRFFSAVDSRLRSLGVTRAQWYVLTHVYYFDGLTQQELADRMDLTKSSAAKLIRKLEQRGWVERRDDAEDGRLQRVHLVARWRPVVEALAKVSRAILLCPLSTLDKVESDELTRLLRKLEVSLDDVDIDADARVRKTLEETSSVIRELKEPGRSSRGRRET